MSTNPLIHLSLLISISLSPLSLAQPDQLSALPFYSPCQFPSPNSAQSSEVSEYYRVCNSKDHLEFLCDLHLQLSQHNMFAVGKAFEKHKMVLETKGASNIGILLVRQLAPPVSSELVVAESPEFGCLFNTPCQVMSDEQVYKFVHNTKTFTKLYTSSLFSRWFPSETCQRAKVLIVIVIDGVLGDARKLTSVNLHTDDPKLSNYIANIQLESANTLLQGVPIVEAMAETIDQVGNAFREYYITNGEPRRHVIPMWAWELGVVSVLLVVLALCIEWYIVRRKNTTKRSIPGIQVDSVRSKTHLIF